MGSELVHLGRRNRQVMGSYRPPLEPFTIMGHAAKTANALRSRTPARLYACEAILERLTQDLQDTAAELCELIQGEHAIVRQQHLARHWHVAFADQTRI